MKTFKLLTFARKKADLAIRELKLIKVRFHGDFSEEECLEQSKKEFEKHNTDYFIDTVVLFEVIV